MDILLIMDAQNSFLSESGSVYMGEKAEILKVRLVDLLSGFPKKKLFFREKHAEEDDFFTGERTHSIATTDDTEVHKDLIKYADDFCYKTRYDAFFDTPFAPFLKRFGARHVGLAGLETHTSIMFTAESLRNIGYEVTVVEPCTMSRDDYMHNYAIALMRNFLGVRING